MRLTTASLVCCVFTVIAIAATARAAQGDINVMPPTQTYEVDPGERPGYVFAPGYWRWDGKRHVWVPGRWLAAREGYEWIPDQWQQRGEKWHFAAGHWELAEGYEEVIVVEEPVLAKAEPAAKPKAKKRHKKINYNDRNKWPRYRRL